MSVGFLSLFVQRDIIWHNRFEFRKKYKYKKFHTISTGLNRFQYNTILLRARSLFYLYYALSLHTYRTQMDGDLTTMVAHERDRIFGSHARKVFFCFLYLICAAFTNLLIIRLCSSIKGCLKSGGSVGVHIFQVDGFDCETDKYNHIVFFWSLASADRQYDVHKVGVIDARMRERRGKGTLGRGRFPISW